MKHPGKEALQRMVDDVSKDANLCPNCNGAREVLCGDDSRECTFCQGLGIVPHIEVARAAVRQVAAYVAELEAQGVTDRELLSTALACLEGRTFNPLIPLTIKKAIRDRLALTAPKEFHE